MMQKTNSILMLTHSTGTAVIDTGTLIRIEAISNYSKLYFANGKTLVVAKVLKWFEAMLTAEGFVRVHRSHLVNTAWIESTDTSARKIQLRNNSSILISRRKHHAVNWYLQHTKAA